MIENSIKALLNNTMMSIRATSTGTAGWNTIVSMYEKAITLAEQNKYFSVEDALESTWSLIAIIQQKSLFTWTKLPQKPKIFPPAFR